MRIAVSLRVIEAQGYKETRDAIDHRWIPLISSAGHLPILIPNTLNNISEYLDKMKIEAVILTGGNDISNQYLNLSDYSPAGESLERDNTEKKIIDFALNKDLPVIGFCRGLQFINVYFRGKLKLNIEGHSNTRHIINFNESFLQNFYNKSEVEVNSYHCHGITPEILGQELEIIALNKSDNTIEAVKHKSKHVTGIMWHPEREKNTFNEQVNFINFLLSR